MSISQDCRMGVSLDWCLSNFPLNLYILQNHIFQTRISTEGPVAHLLHPIVKNFPEWKVLFLLLW